MSQLAAAGQEELARAAGIIMTAVEDLRGLGYCDEEILVLFEYTIEARRRLNAPERQH